MEKDVLRKYKNITLVENIQRFKALVIDALILFVVSLILIILSMNIISNTNTFVECNDNLKSEMLICYKIEEEAKIYEFTGQDDEKYTNLRKQEEIFEDYCLRHILYSYSKNPTPFNNYGIDIKNENNLEMASYESDNLAYFYVNYCTKYNNYNGKNNDIVEIDENPKLYYYKQYKKYAIKTDMWVFDEENYELPYLEGYFAVDLYKYLFEDSSYQTGLTNFNYLAANYNALWEVEVKQLVNSSRFNEHYNIYKENYEICAAMVNISVILSYGISFICTIIVPQIIFKDGKTIGKKVSKISVIDQEGYIMSLWQIILRNISLFFEMAGVLIFACFLAGGTNAGWMYPFITINGIGISLFTILICLLFVGTFSYVITIFTKKKKSLHDLLCKTICIDDRYQLSNEKSQELMDEEYKKNSTQIDIEQENTSYFDSSSFNNTERVDKTKNV